jgi:hypothetical protein
MRCGLLPHDPVALAASPRHTFGAVQPSPELDRRKWDFQPGLYGNDKLANCTVAGLANAARAVSALNGSDLYVEDDLVPAFFADIAGNPPDLAAVDGLVMLDVLAYQALHGFPIGTQTPLVGRSATVATNRTAVAQALCRLGPVLLGVTLRERDMEDLPKWDAPYGRDDGAEVSGHMVVAIDYNGLVFSDTVRVATWGHWKGATWEWLNSRLDEAHAVVWRQLERADGTFYAGLSADDLVAELDV